MCEKRRPRQKKDRPKERPKSREETPNKGTQPQGLHERQYCTAKAFSTPLQRGFLCCAVFDNTMSDDQARMWEISENLHRAELTALEHDEQVAEWARLAEKQMAQVAPRGPVGHRPEGGIRKASRELGIERTEVRRAVKVDSLTPPSRQREKRGRTIKPGCARSAKTLLPADVFCRYPGRHMVGIEQGTRDRFDLPAVFLKDSETLLRGVRSLTGCFLDIVERLAIHETRDSPAAVQHGESDLEEMIRGGRTHGRKRHSVTLSVTRNRRASPIWCRL